METNIGNAPGPISEEFDADGRLVDSYKNQAPIPIQANAMNISTIFLDIVLTTILNLLSSY
jgi:hypothetical protein